MTIFGLNREELQAIASNADMGQRKAKAAMDQNPQYEEDFMQLSSFLYIVQLGTGMAVRDDPGDEPPVPHMWIYLPHEISIPGNAFIEWAWRDAPGFNVKEMSPGGWMSVTQPIIGVTALPRYTPSREDHKKVNNTILHYKDWFIRTLNEHERKRDLYLEQQRIERANAFIESIAREIAEGDDIELNPVFTQA